MPDRSETCAWCRFWVRENDGVLGECHRNPPQPQPGDDRKAARRSSLPVTDETQWCGEWRKAAG